jgi:hypothetical protein
MADRLRVTELDFDTIKNNLKAFLNQQTEFTDYDFEGSGLSVLLDILAYNTHYNAYYLNMVANESFLDTALLRDSVVSHAKKLGYTPYSQRAPIATINLTVNSSTSNTGYLTLPSGYGFLSNQIDGSAYNFVILEDTIVAKANSQYYFENVDIYEGQLVTYNFTHNQATNPKQVFSLPESNIDTTTIRVSVRPAVGNTQVAVYSKVTDILDVSSTSDVYYLQENKSGKFQIYFGNDIVGKKLPDGAVVSVRYLVTNGTDANKANNFIGSSSLTDSLNESLTNFNIRPVSAAAGGSVRESIDEIKFNSAAQFTTQNRLVTFKDYESYLRKNYPAIDSLSVWGGEDETPPVFGKVYIAIKPKANYYITPTEKKRIIDDIIKPKAIVSVDAEIRDPEYLYLLISNYVEYDKNKTTQSADSIKNAIRTSIGVYNSTILSKFGSVFVLSKLQDSVDNVDSNSIRGSETIIRLQKRFEPDLSIAKTYTINFNAELNRGTVNDRLVSTEFNVYDQFGILRTAQIEEIADSFTGISEIQVANPGTGYTGTPTVTISGDGTGAEATAKVVNGRIENITITNRGVDYTRAIITITGGNGYGATAIAVLDARFGKIRTYYYDENAKKKIINATAGTIDYTNGVIVLNDFRVLSSKEPDGLIRLTVKSQKGILTSSKNTIITIDEADPTSISTELVAI